MLNKLDQREKTPRLQSLMKHNQNNELPAYSSATYLKNSYLFLNIDKFMVFN